MGIRNWFRSHSSLNKLLLEYDDLLGQQQTLNDALHSALVASKAEYDRKINIYKKILGGIALQHGGTMEFSVEFVNAASEFAAIATDEVDGMVTVKLLNEEPTNE